MKNYTTKVDQVLKVDGEDFVPDDLVTTSILDRANVILYAIYKLVPYFDVLYLVDDTSSVEEDMSNDVFSLDTIWEAAEILRSYGVILDDSDDIKAANRWQSHSIY